MNRRKWYCVAKYTGYILIIIILYVLQTTPHFLTILGVKPNLIIPAAVCIAIHEGEFVGGLYGAFAGVLCDVSGYSIFGLNAILLLAACTAVGLLVIYLLRPGIINFVLLLSGVLLARGLFDFLLNFVMWGYADVWRVLVYDLLPGIIYTIAVSPLIYYLFTRVYRAFAVRLQD